MIILVPCFAVIAETGDSESPVSILLPDQVPISLLEYQLNDSAVDFYLMGGWESTLGLAAGLVWEPDGDGGYSVDSGLPSTLSSAGFSNTVDMLLSLWVDNTYFFESSFVSGFTDNSIVAGYMGNGLLQSLIFGNDAIGTEEYLYQPFGDGVTGSPGIAAILAGPNSSHELMLRYDRSSEVTRTFSGGYETSDSELSPGEYIRGKYFLLPDSEAEDLEVWLESDAGDTSFGDRSAQSARADSSNGPWFRRLVEGDEWGYISSTGELSLAEDLPDGSILVYYTKNAYDVGDAALGNIWVSRIYPEDGFVGSDQVAFSLTPGGDFETYVVDELNTALGDPVLILDDFTKLIDGTTYLEVYTPGRFSPFEISAYYEYGNSADSAVLSGGSEQVDLNYDTGDGLLFVEPSASYTTTGGSAGTPWMLRYPLLSYSAAKLSGDVYGPGNSSVREFSYWTINLTSIIGEGIALDDEIIPGSLQLYKNGILQTDVSLEDGILQIPGSVDSNDDITLRYRIYDTSSGTGTIQMVSGNRFQLDEQSELELALSGSIGLGTGDDSSTPGSSPGFVLASAGYSHESDILSYELSVAGGFFTSDTHSSFTPDLLTEGTYTVSVDETRLFPSAEPAESQAEAILSTYVATDFSANPLDNDSRALSVFRDFRQSYRGTLLSRDSESTLISQAIGPYPVAATSDDDVSGTLAALEFSLSSAQWTGFQITPADESSSDLFESFSASVLAEGLTGTVHVVLQTGTLSEDLDGDYDLDEQESPSDTGFSFDWGGSSYIAGYPGRAYYSGWTGLTEDSDGNGRADSSNDANIVTKYLGSLNASDNGNWVSLSSGQFTSEEILRFASDAGVRIIVFAESAVDGTLFIGNMKFRYAAGLVGGEDSKLSYSSEAYRLSWSDTSGNARATLNLGKPETGMYRILETELKTTSLPSVTDADIYLNEQLIGSVSLDPAVSPVTLQIQTEERNLVLLSGSTEISTSSFPSSFTDSQLSFLTLDVDSPSAAGALTIDAPVFSQPASGYSAGLAGSLSWRPPNAGLFIGSPWASGLNELSVSSSWFTGSSFGLAGTIPDEGLASSYSMRGYLPFTAVELYQDFIFAELDEPIIESGYRVSTRPISGLSLSSGYIHYYSLPDEELQYRHDAELGFFALENIDIVHSYTYSRESETRNRIWEQQVSGGTSTGILINSDLSLSVDEDSNSLAITPSVDGWNAASGWIESLQDLDWSRISSGTFDRDTAWALRMEHSGQVFQPSAEGSLAASYSETINSQLSSEFSHGFRLGISPFTNSEIAAIRSLNLAVATDQSSTFLTRQSSSSLAGDIRGSWNGYAANPETLVPLYGAGVFLDNGKNALVSAADEYGYGSGQRNVANTYSMLFTLNRFPGSFAQDMYIPSGITLAAERSVTWVRGLVTDTRTLNLTSEWQALNLFGSQGRFRGIAAFATDEYFTTLSYKIDISDTDDWNISYEFSPVLYEAMIFSEIDSQISLEYANLGRSSIAGELSTKWYWTRPFLPGEAIHRKLEGYLAADAELYMKHSEYLLLSWAGYRENYEDGSYISSHDPGLNIVLEHRTGVELEDIGGISAGLALAYENEPLESLNNSLEHRFGIQIDMMVELSY